MASINMDNPVKTSSEEWAASTADALNQAQATQPSVLEQTQPEARGTAQFTAQAVATTASTDSTPDVPGAYPATGAINSSLTKSDPKAGVDKLASAVEKEQEGTPYQVAVDAVENVKQYLPAKGDIQHAVNAVGEAAEKMAAQLGLPMDVTESNEVDKKLSKSPDTPINTTSTLGPSASYAVAGIAGTLGASGAKSEERPIPSSALPSESVISAVNMDTPQLRSSAGVDYIGQSAESRPMDSTHVADKFGDGRPEVAPIPGSALPSSSVIDAVQMDTPKTEMSPAIISKAGNTALPPGAATGVALEKSDSDFPLPQADAQTSVDPNDKDEPMLKPETKAEDQPTLNTEPSKENKHVTEGGGVQVPDQVPISKQTEQASKGLQESSSGLNNSNSNSSVGAEGKKGGKAHRFMEKVKDKLHIH